MFCQSCEGVLKFPQTTFSSGSMWSMSTAQGWHGTVSNWHSRLNFKVENIMPVAFHGIMCITMYWWYRNLPFHRVFVTIPNDFQYFPTQKPYIRIRRCRNFRIRHWSFWIRRWPLVGLQFVFQFVKKWATSEEFWGQNHGNHTVAVTRFHWKSKVMRLFVGRRR